MRLKHFVAVQTSLDTEQKRKLFFQDPATEEQIIDNFAKSMSSVLAVPVATTEVLSFGDVDDVRGLFLEVDADCEVRLNGSGDNISLRVDPGVTSLVKKAKLFLEADLTSVEIENTSPDDILNGTFAVWGDPTP